MWNNLLEKKGRRETRANYLIDVTENVIYPTVTIIAQPCINVTIIFHEFLPTWKKGNDEISRERDAVFNSRNYVSSAMSWKKPPPYLVPRKQDVNTSRRDSDHVIRDTAMRRVSAPKVARAHATSIAFIR